MVSVPQVTVLLSVHNGMPYVPDAVQSVLGQSFRDFELLILDDGSTDETPAYLRSLTDPRVRIERLEKMGLTRALNHGLRSVKTRWIARLDADDIAYPQRLEKQVGYFVAHPKCVLISCHFDKIDAAGTWVGEGFNPLSDLAARWYLLYSTPFVHPGAMFDREAALAVGGYDPEFRLAQDYDLWSRLAARGELGNYPEKLIAKRGDGQNFGSKNSLTQRNNAARIAGAYASAVLPELKADTMEEFFRFLWCGELPQQASVSDLSRAYRRARNYFLDMGQGCDAELLKYVRLIDQQLRWRCLEHARRRLGRPWAAFRWLRLAGSFDPDTGTIPQILRRKARRLFH